MKFEEIEINDSIAKAINEVGFTEMTEIQQLAIPYLLENDADFIGQAQTGTGKTAAFSIPLLEKIDSKSKHIQALVLVPTRELALQVHQDIESFAKYSGIKSQAIQGGVSYDRQISGIRKKNPQVIVGTPGRVIDLIKKGVLKFNNTETIILDEADEMLNMGFLDSVQEIFSLVSEDRKIWMFSATMPAAIRSMIKKDFNNPYNVAVKKKSLSADSIEQKYYLVNERKHLEALCRIIDSEPKLYGIVFCRTRMDTKEVYEELMTRGYNVETLHGDLGQNLRDAAMAKFKRKKSSLMICTDVAARGIDVDNLTHVINYGLPQDSESYVHRIGRTGRAGLNGVAITIIDSRALGRLRRIETMVKSKIVQAKLPTVAELKRSRVEAELQSMTTIAEAVLDKGDDFKLDPTFEIFEKSFENLDKDEALKILFTFMLNAELRSYDEQGDLNEVPKKSKDRGSRARTNVRSGRDRSDRERSDRERSSRRTEVRGSSEARKAKKSSEKNAGDSAGRDRYGRRSDRRNGKEKVHHGGDNLVSFFLDKGKMDGLQLKMFLKELSSQTGIHENKIHNVRLKPSFSFFDVPPGMSKKVLANKNIKINNQKVKVEISGK